MNAMQEINVLVKKANLGPISPLSSYFRDLFRYKPMDAGLKKALGKPIDYFSHYSNGASDASADQARSAALKGWEHGGKKQEQMQTALADAAERSVRGYAAITGHGIQDSIAAAKAHGIKLPADREKQMIASRQQDFRRQAADVLRPLVAWKKSKGITDSRFSQIANQFQTDIGNAKTPEQQRALLSKMRNQVAGIMAPTSWSMMAASNNPRVNTTAARNQKANMYLARTAPAASSRMAASNPNQVAQADRRIPQAFGEAQ